MIYEILHRTRYDYDVPVTTSLGEIHQLPRDIDGQVCLRRSLSLEPEPEHFRERSDYFGNLAAIYSIREPHTQLVVTSSSVVDTSGRPTGFGRFGERSWESFVPASAGDHGLEAVEFSLDSALVSRSAAFVDYARPSFPPGRSLAEAVLDLSARIHDDFVFDTEATDVDTPLEEVMELRRGVCQDFAHALLGSLRSMGLAARYVSGYLETDPPPGQPALTGVDRTHAWVAVFLGAGRWVGVDPTNDQIAGHRYVTTAHGRDYADVPPLKGVIFADAIESRLTVSVDVAPNS
ncbi:MAG: transglutaminase family protein [Acidimicrobiia bacterium]|nr:transglutaminase family protein [Acidimicrobiia bacterium]